MPAILPDDEMLVLFVVPVLQSFVATIKARWGTVEKWAAEAPRLPGMPGVAATGEVIDLLRVAEANFERKEVLPARHRVE